MKEAEPLVGIDLGTTNSVVAYIDPHGRPISLPNSEGDILTPSAVYFEEDGPGIVGKEALKAGALDPENLVEAVKRDMGKPVYHRPIHGKRLPPAAISGVILHRLVEDAAQRTGPFSRAVVTVPAYFNEPRRKATMDAARMAGLKEVELLNEPTAAALAFGYELGVFSEQGKIDNTKTKVPGQFNLLVYDLGGGTFDVTLMRIRDRTFQAVVCDGDVQLGGLDWDERIIKYAVECFQREFKIDLREDPDAMHEVRVQAEQIKKSLTLRNKGILRLQHAGHRITIEMNRQDFVDLTADLLGRTRLTCELAMLEAKIGWDQMDAILLVGGSSRMPMVRDMLFEMSGIEPSRVVSPDEAVAHGAALYAQMLWGEQASGKIRELVKRPPARIINVNSHSLGIVGRNKKTNERMVSVLIPKNTPLPHSNTKTFHTRIRGQRKIYIQIVEGESHDPEECTVIGECRLVSLPENLPAGWPVKVSFAYRRDGRVFVEAEVKGAEPFQVEIDRNQEISDEEAEAWASELIGRDPDTVAPPPSRIKVAKVHAKRPAPPPRSAPTDQEESDFILDD